MCKSVFTFVLLAVALAGCDLIDSLRPAPLPEYNGDFTVGDIEVPDNLRLECPSYTGVFGGPQHYAVMEGRVVTEPHEGSGGEPEEAIRLRCVVSGNAYNKEWGGQPCGPEVVLRTSDWSVIREGYNDCSGFAAFVRGELGEPQPNAHGAVADQSESVPQMEGSY